MKHFRRLFMLLIPVLLVSCFKKGNDHGTMTVFRYNESAGITSLDPAFARNQANIWAVNQLYNSLVQLDSNLNIQPCIARKWTISDDGKSFTFYLRDDVYFHDNQVFKNGKGRKVTARDVVYSLFRLADDKLASPGAWVMGPVLKINGKPAIHAPDDTTVVIVLNKPFPPFLGMLGMQYCSVVPREAVEYYGNEFRSHPVGTGPFYFKMWKEGVKLVMLKNPGYFETEEQSRLPYLDAVSVSFIIDKQSAFLEFVKGNLDFMSGLDASYKDELLTSTGKLNPKYNHQIQLRSQPYLNTEYLGVLFDEKNPVMRNNPLTDIRIRKAINMGFDREKMIRYLRNGIGQPGTHGFIPYGLPGFALDSDFGYQYNPAEARKLLSEAGYPEGAGLPPITLSTNASYLDLCQFIQSQLSQIGIDLRIDVSPPATLRENIAQARVAFFRGSWIADYPDAENYLSLFSTSAKSPAGPNYTQYSSPVFDELYKKASLETDADVRSRLYREMDSLVMQDAPVIVLFYDQVLRFSQRNISGLGSNPLNLLELKRVKKRNNEK
ncbi:MAG: ABC transporter substrate-binding protein [Lentimicrobiaceae bacterium]|nr:ABC transporter substrate-binding protein [Lentimicrobiaceae bacterium]MCB9023232.1 ABC transporter substrate-binding protein [Lentimicrobiaceae bacterium]MCO5266492.1 ABC transporter substrate-binding protein [Lentimicrobium sp.]